LGTAIGAGVGALATGAAGKAIGGFAGKVVTGSRKIVTKGEKSNTISSISVFISAFQLDVKLIYYPKRILRKRLLPMIDEEEEEIMLQLKHQM